MYSLAGRFFQWSGSLDRGSGPGRQLAAEEIGDPGTGVVGQDSSHENLNVHVCSCHALPPHHHRLRSRAAIDLHPHPASHLERAVSNKQPEVLGHRFTVRPTPDLRHALQ